MREADVFKHSTPSLYHQHMGPLLFEPYAKHVAERLAITGSGPRRKRQQFGPRAEPFLHGHDCFRKLGQWVVSCHAKDLAWIPEYNVHFAEVVPGRGEIDHAAYLKCISQLPVGAPLMLEHLNTPGEYQEGLAYIQKVAAREGIGLA